MTHNIRADVVIECRGGITTGGIRLVQMVGSSISADVFKAVHIEYVVEVIVLFVDDGMNALQSAYQAWRW